MADTVVPPRIELGYQVPETCVLSIVLRDRNQQNYGKNASRAKAGNLYNQV